MPILPSLISLVLTVILLSSSLILPALNLHIALNRENILLEKAQFIVDQNRLQPDLALNILNKLNVNGLRISQISSFIQGDYIIYQISFNHTSLFANKFLPRVNLEQNKTLTVISDLV